MLHREEHNMKMSNQQCYITFQAVGAVIEVIK